MQKNMALHDSIFDQLDYFITTVTYGEELWFISWYSVLCQSFLCRNLSCLFVTNNFCKCLKPFCGNEKNDDLKRALNQTKTENTHFCERLCCRPAKKEALSCAFAHIRLVISFVCCMCTQVGLSSPLHLWTHLQKCCILLSALLFLSLFYLWGS